MPYKDPEVRRKRHAEYLRNRYRDDVDYRAKHRQHTRNRKQKFGDTLREIIEESAPRMGPRTTPGPRQ